jgi:hypothetical protein
MLGVHKTVSQKIDLSFGPCKKGQNSLLKIRLFLAKNKDFYTTCFIFFTLTTKNIGFT